MWPYLFLSDLHLHSSRPDITRIFIRFLQSGQARQSQAIYILGDLFEFWVGDDTPDYPDVINALHELTDSGTMVYFMRGNRDFLVGDRFQQMTGCMLLPDPTTIDINGEPVLLMHGDTLCTDDIEYQEFRNKVRSEEWQSKVLAMPLDERLAFARNLREDSKKTTRENPADIMDVNQQTVEQQMRAAGTALLIHGHTHRKNIHHFDLDGSPVVRIVLGDWYETGSLLLLASISDYRFVTLDNQPGQHA